MPLSKQDLDALRKRYKIGAKTGRVPGFIETGIRQSAPAELLGYGLTPEEEDALRASEPSFGSRIGSGAISGGLDFLPALGLGLAGVGGPLALAGVFGAGGGVKSYRGRQRQAQREGRELNASDYAGALKDAAFEGLLGATLPVAGRAGAALVKNPVSKFAASLASEVAYINAAKKLVMGEPIDVENVAEDLVLLGLFKTTGEALGQARKIKSKVENEKPNSTEIAEREKRVAETQGTLQLPYYPSEPNQEISRVRGRKPSQSEGPIAPEATPAQAREAEFRTKAQKEGKATTPVTPEQLIEAERISIKEKAEADRVALVDAKGKRFAEAARKESERRKSQGIEAKPEPTANTPEKAKKRLEFYDAEDYGRMASEVGNADLRDLFGSKRPKRLATQPKKALEGRLGELGKIASNTGALPRAVQKSQQRGAVGKATQQEFRDAALKKQKALPNIEKKGLPAPEPRKGLPSPQEIYKREGIIRGQAPTERAQIEFKPRPSEAQKKEITKTSYKQEPSVKAQQKAIRAVKKQIRNRAREIVEDAVSEKRRPTKTDIKAAETLAYGLIARDPTIPKELRQRAAKAARELEQSLSKDKGYERDLFGTKAPEKPTTESIKSLKDSSPRKVTERTLGLTKKFAKQVVDTVVKKPKMQESVRENKKAIKEAATTIEKEAFRCL